ncbi:MAG: DegT/DnrJ/EryC1/StrS family aminotransferase [Lentisphaeria bacterium]|nr:DegT/DnrJ/EryC1/StrS family aminotransferase [Lentisphaeria bacterium]
MKIPQCSPLLSYLSCRQEIDEAVQRVLASGWYILGREVASFEEAFAEHLGAKYCVGVANGTDADELLLRGIGVGPGDKVATVANTAVATVAAIERTGAAVRFADIDPGTFTMSPGSLAELLQKEPDIRAVVAVHLFGHPADMPALREVAGKYGVPVVEDCAQAHGAMIGDRSCGTFGPGSAFSFYPTKNLGALGDGGAVVTSDAALAEKIRALRQYGWTRRYISECSGVNSRLDELQAAVLAVKLARLEEDNGKRRAAAACYTSALGRIGGLVVPCEKAGFRHVYHQYVLRVPDGRRDELMAYLAGRGVGCAVHYPLPIHRQPAYRGVPLTVGLSATEEVNSQLLSLPMFPELESDEIAYVVGCIGDFFG